VTTRARLLADPARAWFGRAGLRRVLAVLCVTEVTSWGVLYYAFPVLSGRIAEGTGWSPPGLAAAFSGALVVSGVAGIGVGRWIDRHGPRWVMTVGSVVAALALVGVATASTLVWFTVSWLLVGVAMSAVLYPPAFAALTRWAGPRRVEALTVLTVAGGLASTTFAPVTAALAGWVDWRGVFLVLALVLAVVTVPAHAIGLRDPWPPLPEPAVEPAVPPVAVATSRPFVLLALAFALTSCASYAVVVNLVPLLTDRGIGLSIAALTLGLGGAGQVAGRLVYPRLHARLQVRARTVTVMAGVAACTALVAVVGNAAGLLAAVVAGGVVRGMVTLLHATAVSERWGIGHYGRLTGKLSAPVMVSAALAPWLGSILAATLGSYSAMAWVMAAGGVLAAVLAAGSVPSTRPSS
jgi:MFS family permease